MIPGCPGDPPAARLAWPAPSGAAVASWLCVPGFRAGMLLSVADNERAQKRAARSDFGSDRWRPGRLGDSTFAVAPWLCATTFRWLCSEQRNMRPGYRRHPVWGATDVPRRLVCLPQPQSTQRFVRPYRRKGRHPFPAPRTAISGLGPLSKEALQEIGRGVNIRSRVNTRSR
jgi:hypothetical protein